MLLDDNHTCFKGTFLGSYILKVALLISFTLHCTQTFEVLFYLLLMSPQTLKKHTVLLVQRDWGIFVIRTNSGILENSVIVLNWMTALKGLPQPFSGQCSLSIPPENIREPEVF